MKEVMLSLLFFFSIWANAQTDTLRIQSTEPTDSTAIGTPDGKLVSKEIGVTGGAIISDDGKVELIFPQGALTENTKISIQPTINLAPNGAGKAYAFEPSGIQFKKPVQIIFHYTDEEAEICPADLMGLAIQDHTGKWTFIDYTSWDSTSKKLNGFLNHFSQASNIYMLELRATRTTLRVGENTILSLVELTPKYKKKSGKQQYTFKLGKIAVDKRILWKVNEVPNGDEFVGEILEGETLITKGIPLSYIPTFQYDAPKKYLPDENPVTIKASLGTFDADNYFRPQLELSCKISIYDEYKIKITDTVEARVSMGTFIADSGTFVVRITKRGIGIEEIKNYPPFSYKLFEPPRPFKITVDTKEPCLGTINIGAHSIQLYKNKPPTAPDVLITFHTPEILAYKFTLSARGISTDAVSKLSESIPNLINFRLNGEAQTIRVSSRIQAPYNIYITPIRNR